MRITLVVVLDSYRESRTQCNALEALQKVPSTQHQTQGALESAPVPPVSTTSPSIEGHRDPVLEVEAEAEAERRKIL